MEQITKEVLFSKLEKVIIEDNHSENLKKMEKKHDSTKK
jgi:hypothetical protein